MLIGFITASDLTRYFPDEIEPLLTHDDAVLARALTSLEHVVEPVVWGTDVSALKTFDLLIVRSPWDYMDSDENRCGLFAWLREVAHAGIRLENDISWLLWNSDKSYLAELAENGAKIVPTTYLNASMRVDNPWLAQHFSEHGPFVLKPCVSAAARDTFLIDRLPIESCLSSLNGEVSGDFSTWRADRSFMVQPFLPEIMTHGEWSLVYFRGIYSHSVHKRPALGEWLVQDELGGTVVSAVPPELVFAAAEQTAFALSRIAQQRHLAKPLYMRIDIIETATGPLTSEVEMIEPELFFLERREDRKHVENTAAVAAVVRSFSTSDLPEPG